MARWMRLMAVLAAVVVTVLLTGSSDRASRSPAHGVLAIELVSERAAWADRACAMLGLTLAGPVWVAGPDGAAEQAGRLEWPAGRAWEVGPAYVEPVTGTVLLPVHLLAHIASFPPDAYWEPASQTLTLHRAGGVISVTFGRSGVAARAVVSGQVVETFAIRCGDQFLLPLDLVAGALGLQVRSLPGGGYLVWPLANGGAGREG